MSEPRAFDLSQFVVDLRRDGSSRVAASRPGPPVRIDGYTIGAPVMSRPPPHAGEMHPDGDELLFLVSGHASVLLETEPTPTTVELRAGQAVVVPRGVWHRISFHELSQLVHVTPGPGGAHRPLGEGPV